MSDQDTTDRHNRDVLTEEEEPDKRHCNCVIVITVIIEIFILAVVCVLAYFLR